MVESSIPHARRPRGRGEEVEGDEEEVVGGGGGIDDDDKDDDAEGDSPGTEETQPEDRTGEDQAILVNRDWVLTLPRSRGSEAAAAAAAAGAEEHPE